MKRRIGGRDPMPEGSKYIYCVIKCEGERDFAIDGVGGQGDRVYTINYRDLAAVVSDFSSSRQDITPQSLKSQQRVMEEVMKAFSVLPVGFGCIASDAAQIRDKVLKAKYRYLHQTLRQMENKVELVLKALWIDPQVAGQVAANPRLKRLQRIAATGGTPHQRFKLGLSVKEELGKHRKKAMKEMLPPLDSIAVDRRLNKVTTPTIMIFNASFLVEKEREAEFDRAVNELGEKYGDRVRFIYVGPLPPYDFVDMAIRL